MKIAIINAVQNLSGNVVSAMIDKIGFGSILTFVGLKVGEEAGALELANNINEAWSMSDWALLGTIIGTVSFIVKNIIESRLAWKKSNSLDEDKS